MTSKPDNAVKADIAAASKEVSQLESQIDLLISLKLHEWPALALATQNSWGGAASADKRDWLCAAVSELLSSGQVSDVDDLEEVLIQVMLDEFEVVVDDGSPAEIAHGILRGRQLLLQGDDSDLQRTRIRWEERQRNGPQELSFTNGGDAQHEEGTDEEQSDSGSSHLQLDDIDMDEAPEPLTPTKYKRQEPEIDEDGFTKVVGRKKR